MKVPLIRREGSPGIEGWDGEKARQNVRKHGVSFDEARE